MTEEKTHKVGVNENWLMSRHLRLEGSVEKNHQLIVQEVDQLLGVDAVSINATESLLNVAYDATKRQLDEIEEIVRKHECDIAHDWWTHFKEGYYKFVDQNVKDNASHEPWSCHKRPPGR
ncbi:cation transporter [Dasania sp. GY-19]|uniref:Cation transporter n=1 Tax=Dasania phycosphaerae TaxID=2950436 RepID=A0A9J6RS25_9GAMM|nr:cation transporter [Dasania phycosphaerae]MCZ0867244.1 cation transporter [Dasania phycosphaerae]